MKKICIYFLCLLNVFSLGINAADNQQLVVANVVPANNRMSQWIASQIKCAVASRMLQPVFDTLSHTPTVHSAALASLYTVCDSAQWSIRLRRAGIAGMSAAALYKAIVYTIENGVLDALLEEYNLTLEQLIPLLVSASATGGCFLSSYLV